MAIPGRMTKFKISELSGVTKPAQEGARAVFMKRDDTVDENTPVACPFIKRDFTATQRKTLAASGKALPDGSFPIENEADLHNAISAAGRATDKAAAEAHIISRAKAMGMSGALPDGWVSKSGEESTMDKELRKSLGLAETATDAEVISALTKAKAQSDQDADDAKKEAAKTAKALAKASMTDKEKTHTSSMSDDATDAFMAKPKADRETAMAKALEGDETLVVKGESFRKSIVGEGAFAIIKAQQAEIADNALAIAKANEATATAMFTKQAETEFAHVAGTVPERVALLKSIEAMTDPVAKKAAQEGMKAQEALAKVAFTRVGAGGGLEPGFAKGAGNGGGAGFTKADGELDRLAKEYEKAHAGTSYAKAYDTVVQANPQLYEQSQQEARQLAAAN